MSAAGKPRLRARFQGGTSTRAHDVRWAIVRAPRSGLPGGLTGAERAVLHAIETFVGYDDRETGWARPSVKTLGDAADVNERQARYLLRELEAKGWIESEARSRGGWQGASAYRVTPPSLRGDDADGESPIH